MFFEGADQAARHTSRCNRGRRQMTLDELYAAGWNLDRGYDGPKRMGDALYSAGKAFLAQLPPDTRLPDDCFLVNGEDGHADDNDCLNLLWEKSNDAGDSDDDELTISLPDHGDATAHVCIECVAVVEPKDYARKLGGLIQWLT